MFACPSDAFHGCSDIDDLYSFDGGECVMYFLVYSANYPGSDGCVEYPCLVATFHSFAGHFERFR